MAKRVLIADDEPNIVLSLEFLLVQAGYEVATAATGEATLDTARRIHPDLILLDVMLPRKNGFEVCQTVRADPQLSATKIVMLTAKGRSTEIAKGLALGADAYVTKPFGTRELVDTVRTLIGP
ncbi:MAG: response regulator [Burkholderiales bacterium]|nr:response regulator [Burkholderiales bacterium]